MRICDDRYHRDRQRFDVALRLIRHEARTHTIRAWTGLSDDRIRKLYRSYARAAHGDSPVRHRGKSPQRIGFFTRSGRTRQEAAVLASLCRLLGAMPESPLPEPARALPSLARAELLCQAYEAYRGLVPEGVISFEHAVFLLTALVRGEELVLGHCPDCGAAMVVDRCCLRPPRCAPCSADQTGSRAGFGHPPEPLAAPGSEAAGSTA